MPRTSLGIDPETGAEKFEVTDDSGKVIGYDLVFSE
jgi:hypothetical protein